MPGFTIARAASAASSTASYTWRWIAVKVPEIGRVRVMSAVYSESSSMPASSRIRSPGTTGPSLRVQCSVQACGPLAAIVS